MQISTWILFSIINLVTSVINGEIPFRCKENYFEVCTRHATPQEKAQLVSGRDQPSHMAMVAPQSKQKVDSCNCVGQIIAGLVSERANCCYGDRKDVKGFFHLMEEDMRASDCQAQY
ncbi:uncharacterized protein PGTG_20293 [Puccinia graminis f. sp. tritici CRL 75-36-700-3]|uniref:Uncharacterized protein n=1 Tax=Puccinia graminis f. sp. tritici (strain CRL 75-36-700-3 / race SCCL) TaxID=418459 RepID=E3NXP0_PUCGT|nr:uncharacterized protein PGTG_20293 [Puccinia graminis f. sp. tritici CRL 75-36-700-3]EFP94339.2 hypothetical protein PGTG_20293 [Puccinia graminis f. sp. tritici CRL 75-36-700-3]